MTDTKIALVTGATRGLGFETARKLAKTGCTVLLGARNMETGGEKARELRAEGYDVHAIEVDLERHETFEAVARQIEDRFGRLDILINNAGILDFADGPPSVAPIGILQKRLRGQLSCNGRSYPETAAAGQEVQRRPDRQPVQCPWFDVVEF